MTSVLEPMSLKPIKLFSRNVQTSIYSVFSVSDFASLISVLTVSEKSSSFVYPCMKKLVLRAPCHNVERLLSYPVNLTSGSSSGSAELTEENSLKIRRNYSFLESPICILLYEIFWIKEKFAIRFCIHDPISCTSTPTWITIQHKMTPIKSFKLLVRILYG